MNDKLKTDLLRATPGKAILSLSIPIILLNILRSGFNIVDMFWLGKLGKDFLAGVSASIFMVWAANGLTELITVGIVAGVSRNIGEGKIDVARSNCLKSLKFSLILGLFFTTILFPLTNPLVSMIKVNETADRAGIEYLQIMIAFTFVSFLISSLRAILIAWGDVKTPVKVSVVTFVFNIFFSPILIFGVAPFPRLETKGAAIATISSYLLAALFYSAVIIKNRWIGFKTTGEEIKFSRYISVGYPVALSSMFFSFIYFFIAKITAVFGAGAIGAMGIGHKIESLTYNMARGFAAGLSTYVGRNLGAGFEKRASDGANFAIKISCLISLIYSASTIIFAKQIVSFFNNDPLLVKHGIDYLIYVMPAEILQCGMIAIESGAFAGSGFTKPSFSIALPITFFRIPLAWFFAIFLNLGAVGIWLTISLTMTFSSLIFFFLYKQNRWLKSKV